MEVSIQSRIFPIFGGDDLPGEAPAPASTSSRKASNSTRSFSNGSPTTLLNEPEMDSTKSSPFSWMPYAPALSNGLTFR